MVNSADILKAKILVVDDKQANVSLIAGVLRVAGYTSVSSTTDSSTVCDLYRQVRYSLILLDLHMPGMDGFQVMEGLKEIEGEGYLPVLVITAQPEQKLRALKAGAKDFVSKPFDMAELQARVHNILEVRLLHQQLKNYSQVLEETVGELEATREVLRLKALEEQKKSEQELTLAQETQQSLLPRSVPEFENFLIHAYNNPTRYVGGDFYDFTRLSSGEWVGVVADVAGKGISAALLSSMVLGALSVELRSGSQPHEALNRVNRLLCEKSLDFQFVSLFIFLLSPNGTGHFISAGHNPAYVFRASTGKIKHLLSTASLLGMFESASYEPWAFQLEKGDILVVYSDGLTDARNQDGEMFGEERLLELIRREARAGSQALEQKLLATMEEFTRGVSQMDDITFLIAEKRV